MTATKYEGVQRWLPAVGLDRRDDRDYSVAKMVKHPGGDQGIAYVTHADYRALEERHQALLNAIARGHALADRTNKIDRPKVIGMAILDDMKDWA
jgi:hypothetical protein